jgi:hypothetical protein
MGDDRGYVGYANESSDASDLNRMSFVIERILARVSTATLVIVKSVTNEGGVSAVGYVDVQPLVSQLSGDGQATPHGTIYEIPYMRLQGGTNAIILDPQVGDIGICVFANRDISSVKATKAVANPGSRRRFDMADGLYLGGVLNGVPEQFIRFSSEGIEVKADLVTVTGSLSVSTGATGSFTTGAGDTVTVRDGIITNIF